jgi:RNA polymerase sigma-70 factor, ECF subfamily
MIEKADTRDAILAAIPSLRAVAISLASDPERADDMVQETLVLSLSHLDRFEPGTNLRAWLFAILRNRYYTAYRKRRHEVEDPDGVHAASLTTPPDQHGRLDFEDLKIALARLPAEQREALLLIGAEGISYDEAAAICGIKVGTVKSRVNRARNQLAELMGYERSRDVPGGGSVAATRRAD